MMSLLETRYALLDLRDLKSLCPLDLLKDTSSQLMPWLYDNVSNNYGYLMILRCYWLHLFDYATITHRQLYKMYK